MYKKVLTVERFAGVLTILAITVCSCMASCPNETDVVQFHVNQIVGYWYVVAATPPTRDSVSKCSHFNITSSSPDSFEINFTAVSSRSRNPVTFTANISMVDDISGKWQLKGSNRALGPFKHRILTVNDGAYIVMIVCNPENPIYDFSVILSHEKALSPKTLKELKKKLIPYFSSYKIVNVNQDDCVY